MCKCVKSTRGEEAELLRPWKVLENTDCAPQIRRMQQAATLFAPDSPSLQRSRFGDLQLAPDQMLVFPWLIVKRALLFISHITRLMVVEAIAAFRDEHLYVRVSKPGDESPLLHKLYNYIFFV